MPKTTPTDYQSVGQKMEALEAQKASLASQLASAPEDQKAGLTEQIESIDRKLNWYKGRQNSPKFQQRAQAAQARAEAQATEAASSTGDPSDPRNG